jgi:hypothetical protein
VSVSGTVALDSASLTALENVTATISGIVAVSGPLTDTQLRAAPVPISGTIGLDSTSLTALENITATITGTIPVSGPLTDAQLRAVPVDITGTVGLDNTALTALENVTATISGTVSVSGPLTDTQLRATAVPVADAEARTTLNYRFAPAAGRITSAVRKAAAGDNIIVTPAGGKKIRLLWLGMSCSENNTAEGLAVVKLGSTIIYRWNMYAGGGFSHWQPIDGAVDAEFIVNLSTSQPVDINYTYEEV